MTQLNKNTQKAQAFINNFNRSSMTDLYDLYNNPSGEKLYAERCIREEMVEAGGYLFTITGGNSSFFACAYRLGNDLIYHTHANKYLIKDAFKD